MQPPKLWSSTQIQGKTGWRLFIATVLCGPLAGMGIVAIIGIITVLVNAGSGFGAGGLMPLSVIASGGMFGAIIGWPAMLLFGLPAHALLYRRKSHKIGGYLLAGAMLGLLAAAIIGLLQATSWGGGLGAAVMVAGGMITFILMLASVGAASLFWAIRRPDRDVIPPEKLAATFE